MRAARLESFCQYSGKQIAIKNGTPLSSLFIPEGCSETAESEICSVTQGVQSCALYTALGGSRSCGQYICPGGDCNATANRIDSLWATWTCDNTIHGGGKDAYICNCEGTVNASLAASITSSGFSTEIDNTMDCSYPFEEIFQVTDALAEIQAASAQINLSPVLLNETFLN